MGPPCAMTAAAPRSSLQAPMETPLMHRMMRAAALSTALWAGAVGTVSAQTADPEIIKAPPTPIHTESGQPGLAPGSVLPNAVPGAQPYGGLPGGSIPGDGFPGGFPPGGPVPGGLPPGGG